MASIYNVDTWDSTGSTNYKKNAAVKDANGKFWYALRDDASNNTPQVGSAYWNGYINITVDGTTTAEPYFFWKPSYNVSVTHTPRIKEIQFGDGYTQRLKDGINNDLLNLSLSFESRSELEAVAILHFLHVREGFGPFYFKAPMPYNIIKRFVCTEFSSNFVFDDNYTVQCKFVEVS
jgi:phage-related protein